MSVTDTETEQKAYLREKILHTLKIYPRISWTMLQVGLGPGTSPSLWRPLVNEMIASGELVSEEIEDQTPAGRYQRYLILSRAQPTA